MRGISFSQQIGLAVLLGRVAQRGQWDMQGRVYRYGVTGVGAVVVGRAGTPLYVAPPGIDGGDDSDITSAITNIFTSLSTSTSSSIPAKTTSSASSITSSHSMTSISTTSTTNSSSAPTPTAPPLPDAPAPRQTSSIRYLAPVFILILITLLGWLYSKYSARKHRRQPSTTEKEDPFNPSDVEKHSSSNPYRFGNFKEGGGEGWKEIKDEDEEDVWYAGDDDAQWVSAEGGVARVGKGMGDVGRGGGAVSVQGRGLPWGWKSTFNIWKSARGRGGEGEEVDELGRSGVGKTVKLVTGERGSYQALPELGYGYGLNGDVLDEEGRKGDMSEEKGSSIRGLRDKLVGYTWGRNQEKQDKLGTPSGPGMTGDGVVPPEPPAWIIPATSPINQVISPPLQPGLFFHPAPTPDTGLRSIHNLMEKSVDDGQGSESGSDYSNTEVGMPSIPSTAEELAGSYTALPPRMPRTPKDKEGRKVQTVGKKGGSTVKADKTLKRNPTAPASRIKESTTPTRTKSTSTRNSISMDTGAKSPLRRSIAQKDLTTSSTASSKHVKKRDGAIPGRPKSRIQKREERAQGKVDDILKASWSGRAILASPPPEDMEVGVGLGMVSPGVEEAARLGGGGIEQRLEMLRKLEGVV